MHKIAVLTSVLAMLGTGQAFAFDGSRSFSPSDANNQPVPRWQRSATVDLSTTAAVRRSAPATIRGSVGFSAAMGFGPSDANNQPVPRWQTER